MQSRSSETNPNTNGAPAAAPKELRGWLIDLSHRAGDAVMEIYGKAFDVASKDDASPLTEADLASHRVLVEGLRARTPDWPVVSEEDAADGGRRTPSPALHWLVDPLDGTKEFVKRNGEFTVNVALVQEGRPILGVVHAPAVGVTYSAAEGEGAFRDDGKGERRIHTRPPDAGRAAVVASRSHGNPDTEAFIAALGERFDVERTSIGSSLKLCQVADGSAQYYPRLAPTMAWDTAAAHAVVQQAGGAVVDARTQASLRYARTEEAGWRNPSFLVLYAADAWLPEERTR